MFLCTGQTGHLLEFFSSDVFFFYHSPELNFDRISINSMDATGQRDFVGMYIHAAEIISQCYFGLRSSKQFNYQHSLKHLPLCSTE